MANKDLYRLAELIIGKAIDAFLVDKLPNPDRILGLEFCDGTAIGFGDQVTAVSYHETPSRALFTIYKVRKDPVKKGLDLREREMLLKIRDWMRTVNAQISAEAKRLHNDEVLKLGWRVKEFGERSMVVESFQDGEEYVIQVRRKA